MNTRRSEDIHHKLQQLALEAQRYPPIHRPRRNAIDNLVDEIMKSGLLGHPQQGLWPSELYDELYREALQKTYLEICLKIHNYRPEHPVMAWVNFILNCRFMEVIKEYNHKQIQIFSLDQLDKAEFEEQLWSREEIVSDAKLLRDFLEEDPENLFQSEHIQGHPEATFQALAIARFVEDKTWEKISQEFGIPIPTLSSFVTRRLHKFKSYFHKYLQE
jgi:DNA-directed RNA polymerase specialized sigma24 family protein